jgi:hypothetical protein
MLIAVSVGAGKSHQEIPFRDDVATDISRPSAKNVVPSGHAAGIPTPSGLPSIESRCKNPIARMFPERVRIVIVRERQAADDAPAIGSSPHDEGIRPHAMLDQSRAVRRSA